MGADLNTQGSDLCPSLLGKAVSSARPAVGPERTRTHDLIEMNPLGIVKQQRFAHAPIPPALCSPLFRVSATILLCADLRSTSVGFKPENPAPLPCPAFDGTDQRCASGVRPPRPNNGSGNQGTKATRFPGSLVSWQLMSLMP